MKPYYQHAGITIYHGDCREVLPEIGLVDSVVTDPPYGLEFMGKGWDRGVPGVPFWEAIRKAAKPGAHLLAFGGTRTFHRLGCAIEDAGFEIRDCIMWVYGTGFPKSLDVSKAIDKAAATEAAKQWDGWGTALKPAWEPVIVARNPLVGTVAANVSEYGTGGINIDGCRVNPGEMISGGGNGKAHNGGRFGAHETQGTRPITEPHDRGRWPSNLIHDGSGDVLKLFPESSSGANPQRRSGLGYSHGAIGQAQCDAPRGAESGSAARFFYTAKASRSERDAGLNEMRSRSGGELTERKDGSAGVQNPRAGAGRTSGGRNTHPTVKPADLMRYLVRLVTPRGGVVLDPFMGSGTTLGAAKEEFCQAIGIDLEEEYCEIASKRFAQGVLPLC